MCSETSRTYFDDPPLIRTLNPMRLGIDLDGVVADFNGGWTRFYNRQFGTSLTADSVKRWNQIPDLTHFRHMGEFWRWAAALDGASLFRHLETFPGAVEALEDLAADHEIVIVTTKPLFAVDDTLEWIAEKQLPTTEVHITEEKWEVDCDIFLDDGPHVLPGLVAGRPESVVCRYVRPWNDPVPGAVDVQGWDDFRQVVEAVGGAKTVHRSF
jgi:5'(3')-deoxyribonucleotidase